MKQHTDTNIFACFVSYPSLVADVSEQTKDEAIKKGDMFCSYIWGEAGLDRFLKKIQYSDYGQDLKRILFQFYVLPCDYERMHIKDIENYRKREKAIGISIIIESDFFQYSDAEINFRNQKQAIYNLKNCNVLIISAGQKQSLA